MTAPQLPPERAAHRPQRPQVTLGRAGGHGGGDVVHVAGADVRDGRQGVGHLEL